MTAPHQRPRVVTAAFWCWVVASVLLVMFGLLLAFSEDNLPVLFHGAGALFALAVDLQLSCVFGKLPTCPRGRMEDLGVHAE